MFSAALRNIGNVLFSSRKHACSLNEDAYEGWCIAFIFKRF